MMASAYLQYFFEYSILAFMASLGVLQIAVARAGLDGLSFFRRPVLSYAFGVLAIIAGFALFYATGDRAAEPLRGIEGGVKRFFGERECLAAFMAGAFGALVSTLMVASVAKRAMCSSSRKAPARGLDALREMTFWQAVTNRFRRQR